MSASSATPHVVGILGGGVMGEALAKALLKAGVANLRIAESNSGRRVVLAKTFPVVALHEGCTGAFLSGLNVLVLAVKPQYARAALAGAAVDSAQTLVVSIMAGVDIATLKDLTKASVVVRAMPNMAAAEGKSATVYTSAGVALSPVQQQQCRLVLEALGLAVEVPSELFIDMGTGLVGSGPAFVFLVMEAFVDTAVEMGFTRDQASQLVVQLFDGCVSVLRAAAPRDGPAPISQLRWNVTSPGGTTAAGLAAMEDNRVRTAVRAAILGAAAKATQLGAKTAKL